MSDDPGHFLATGIRAIAVDLPEEVRTALHNKIRAERLALRDQLELVAAAALQHHTLPSSLVVALPGLPERPAALQRAREAADRMVGEREET